MKVYPRFSPRVSMLLLMLSAFALRVWGLADHNLWWDEGIGMWLARMPAEAIIRWTAGDVHPPLYYLLLHDWWLIAGEGEFVSRFPAVLFSLLTVTVTYRTGRALGGVRTGILGALFVTLSRFAIGWAQEVRMYSLATLWSTSILWASLNLWRRDTWRDVLLYVLSTAGALYTLYLTALLPLVVSIGFIVAWWREGRPHHKIGKWLIAQSLTLLLIIPWLSYALPRMHSWSSDSAMTTAFFTKLYITMLTVGTPLHLERYMPLTLTLSGLLLAGTIALWHTQHTPVQRGGVTMLVSGLILPAVVVYLVSVPAFHFYYARPLVPRYLLPLSGCFYLLQAWVIVTLGHAQRWKRGLAGAMLFLSLIAALLGLKSFYPGRVRRDDYASIAAVLKSFRMPQDSVLLYVDRDWPIFVAHYPGPRHDIPYGASLDTRLTDAQLSTLWEHSSGIWLVQTPESLQTDPQQTVPQWLAARAVLTKTWVTGENSLTFYARTAARAGQACVFSPDFTPPSFPQVLGGGYLRGATLPQAHYQTGATVRALLYWGTFAQQPLTLTLSGPEQRSSPLPPDVCIVSWPLTPDLPGGTYHLTLRAADGTELTLGQFTLRHKTAPSEANAAPSHPLEYQLGTSIHLVGYDLPQTAVSAGETVVLRLWWRTTDVLDKRYKVFAHLIGETYNARNGNFLWGQQDNEPENGQAPTTLWAPGNMIVDEYHIPLADDAPPGVYTVEVGMYGLVDTTRLPIFDKHGQPQGDAILLTTITVKHP